MTEDTTDPLTVENRVRRLRRLRGLTQEDFGALLGVSRQTVNAIENGRYDPSLKLAFSIARVFAARIEDVFRPINSSDRDWSELMIMIPERLDADGVMLRPHSASDLVPFQRFLEDDAATQFMAFTADQRTAEGAAAMMDAVIASYATDDPICSLTIADPTTGDYLGSVGGAEAGDATMEVFVTVVAAAQGQGAGTRAMRALQDHLFGTSGVRELRADVVTRNDAAIRLFEGLGYRRVGPIERAASGGEFGHREMEGVRYVLTEKDYKKQRRQTRD